jgi:hypothetical protein
VAKKRTAMKVAVSRMLSQANSLIENVEIGRFPCTDPVNKLPRWTAKQQKELDAAVLEVNGNQGKCQKVIG